MNCLYEYIVFKYFCIINTYINGLTWACDILYQLYRMSQNKIGYHSQNTPTFLIKISAQYSSETPTNSI